MNYKDYYEIYHPIRSMLLFCLNVSHIKALGNKENYRLYWSNPAYKMTTPVLYNMSKSALKKNMPPEPSPTWNISPEATFPVIGIFMTYCMRAFQTLGLLSWKYGLPSNRRMVRRRVLLLP
jgi:hypothetical protein